MLFAPDWTAPLPDFSAPALSRRLRIEGRDFTLQITAVQRGLVEEPDTDLVQLQILHRGRPLTAADLGPDPSLCLEMWSYLCNRVTEAVVDCYAPQQRMAGEPNPRLGCWGTRPDLLENGLAQSDCGIAAVLGIAVWTVGARRIGGDADLVERLAGAVTMSLGYWTVLAKRGRPTAD